MSLAYNTDTNAIQRILILEENAADRSFLQAILSSYFRRTELIFTAKNLVEAKKVIQHNQPSFIFTSVKFSEQINDLKFRYITHTECDVIYTIGEANPALHALKSSGLKCLTKPFKVADLMKIMSQSQLNQINKKIESKSYHSLSSDRITLKSQEGITCISLNSIRRLESDSNYTHFHLKSGEKITVPVTLKKYEDMLPSTLFYRIHQSHIVNLQMVKKFLKEDGGSALLDDGTSVLVSRRKKDGFLSALTA